MVEISDVNNALVKLQDELESFRDVIRIMKMTQESAAHALESGQSLSRSVGKVAVAIQALETRCKAAVESLEELNLNERLEELDDYSERMTLASDRLLGSIGSLSSEITADFRSVSLGLQTVQSRLESVGQSIDSKVDSIKVDISRYAQQLSQDSQKQNTFFEEQIGFAHEALSELDKSWRHRYHIVLLIVSGTLGVAIASILIR